MSQFQVKSVKSTVNKFNDHSPYIQIAASAGCGFITGFIFFRVSKLLAVCVGGAILTIEVAVQAGLVTIDWNKVIRQQEDARRRMSTSNSRAVTRSPFTPPEDSSDSELIEKAKDLIMSSARYSVAFLGGFLMGFGFA